MLGTADLTLADRIIQRLSNAPRQTMADVSVGDRQHTRQAWYKALRLLRDQGVIVRERGGAFSLHQAWMSQMLWLTQRIRANYLQTSMPAVRFPQKHGERVVYRFMDGLSLNSFWGHALLTLAANGVSKTMYGYNPHFWFYLAQGGVERQYNKSMARYGVTTKMVIGGNGFLDRWNAKHFGSDTEWWLSPKPLFPQQRRYINVFGDYVFDIRLHTAFAEQIHRRFSKVQSFDDVAEAVLINELQQHAPCSLTIALNPQKSSAFRKKIERLFG